MLLVSDEIAKTSYLVVLSAIGVSALHEVFVGDLIVGPAMRKNGVGRYVLGEFFQLQGVEVDESNAATGRYSVCSASNSTIRTFGNSQTRMAEIQVAITLLASDQCNSFATAGSG